MCAELSKSGFGAGRNAIRKQRYAAAGSHSRTCGAERFPEKPGTLFPRRPAAPRVIFAWKNPRRRPLRREHEGQQHSVAGFGNQVAILPQARLHSSPDTQSRLLIE